MYQIKQSPEEFVVHEVLDLPKGDGEYAYYQLEKRLLGTEEAVQEVCAALGVKRKDVGYAGSKDRRALTTQWISVRGKQVHELSQGRWSLVFERFGPRPISLGMNQGNRFEIVVHGVDGEVHLLKRFVNYFGEQRFGEENVVIGRLIVHGEFARAAAVLREQGVLRDTTDAIRALRAIPQKTLKMYVHAYQSWMWNECVYELIQRGAVVEHVPMVGFGYDEEWAHDDVVQALLRREQVSPRDFVIRSLPGMSAEGGARQMFVDVNDAACVNTSGKSMKCTFMLPKGAYATELLRQSILQVRSPVAVRVS